MMGGERPSLPTRLKQSVQDDEGIAYDGGSYDPIMEGSEDDDYVRIDRSPTTIPSRRTRSASPLGIIFPLSSGLKKSLLRAEELENSVDDTSGDLETEDDESGGHESAGQLTRLDTSSAGSPGPPSSSSRDAIIELPRTNSGYWRYDHNYGDYVQKRADGTFIGYREYQQRGKSTSAKAAEYSIIDKPKRFYTPGRIFKLNWVDPPGNDKPVTRQRWFVVVKRRLHHSLCFAITTGGGSSFTGNSGKSRGGKNSGGAMGHRGRSRDFVVLFPAGFLPPAADAEEGIEREPIGVIIEDAEQCISPQARLDCARIYTVEFDVAVVKIGRVDSKDLEKLDQYYRECVE